MAGAVYEVAWQKKIPLGQNVSEVQIEVITGTPAVTAAAALLGAPLTHDFCTISLSDRLTKWEVIEKRLDLASQADFVIALYNPKSHGRPWQLGRAVEIISQNLSPSTPVGLATKVGRSGQHIRLTTLEKLATDVIDMQTIVIIGNSNTFVYQDALITPRGYTSKYGPAPSSKGEK
jgi:precorrin-3B C17-methyltransferase